MTAPARVVTTIRPDTVFVPFHWVGANRLTNDALDPASRMPEFKVCAAVGGRRMTERIVIVGGGMAAVRLAEHLAGDDVSLTVLADEQHAPYNRILLSAVLEGTHSADALTLRSPEWFADHGIELRLGARVHEIDREAREVLLVERRTAGLRPARPRDRSDPHPPADPRPGPPRRHPPPQGPPLPEPGGLPPARRVRRVDRRWSRWRPALVTRPRAVVVGGGLLGLQVARALSVRGLLTEVVEGADHLLASQVGPAAGSRPRPRPPPPRHRRLHRRPRRPADRRRPPARQRRVLPTDLVVLTAGGRPSTRSPAAPS